jgi:hypothetical protein
MPIYFALHLLDMVISGSRLILDPKCTGFGRGFIIVPMPDVLGGNTNITFYPTWGMMRAGQMDVYSFNERRKRRFHLLKTDERPFYFGQHSSARSSK